MRRDREDSGSRSIYKSYVVDDGWNVPQMVIEVIDIQIKMAWEDAYRLVCEQHKNHRGDWLTMDVARKYEAKSWVYRVLCDNQYIGMVRKLGLELQEKYGVTEVEAINIMCGVHVRDYVNKYYRIKNLIPLRVDEQGICDAVLEEFGYGSLAI